MPNITERTHDRYMIKAGMLNNGIVARAFPMPPSRFRHLVAEATGSSVEEAIEALIEKLDVIRRNRQSQRRADAILPCGVPTCEEYADALRAVSPSPRLLASLHEHALCGEYGMTAQELALAGSYVSSREVLEAYRKLAVEFFTVLEPDAVSDNKLPVILNMQSAAQQPEADIRVSLQPELCAAVVDLLGRDRKMLQG